MRITLLAALCSSRQAEITDALVDPLVALVQKINARAERRVERQLTAELKKVRGKEGILFKLADAAIGKPDKIVRTALYPVVGEKTLRDLVAEAKANEKVFKAKVRTPQSGTDPRFVAASSVLMFLVVAVAWAPCGCLNTAGPRRLPVDRAASGAFAATTTGMRAGWLHGCRVHAFARPGVSASRWSGGARPS